MGAKLRNLSKIEQKQVTCTQRQRSLEFLDLIS